MMQFGNYDRCTDRLKHSINDAQELAQRRSDDAVLPEHLFVSMACDGCANEVLRSLGLSLPELQETLLTNMRVGTSKKSELEFDEKSVSVLDRAGEFADSLRHSYLGTEHLIGGLVEVVSPVSWFLQSKGVTSDAIREQVLELLGRGIG